MANTIASALLDAINAVPYERLIAALPQGAGLSETIFPKTRLAKTYLLDMRRWVDGSYMNPNAMFELFGEFNNESGMQIRKRMFKFIGITHQRKAKDCDLLKDAWIALHMQGLSAEVWSKNMRKRDTPGDEIALHILCRMFNRHCVVVTSAKMWSTVKTDRPMSEEELMEICDLKFLFVEPGVFGELRSKPAIPPTPRKRTVFESATDIIRRDKKKTTGQQVAPLNLSVVPPDPNASIATGDNKTDTAKPTLPEPNQSDASTVKTLDQSTPPSAAEVPDMSSSSTNPLDQDIRSSAAEVPNVSPGPESLVKNSASEGEDTGSEAKHCVPKMPVCTVLLHKLKNTEVVKWLGETPSKNLTESDTGYQLRERKSKHVMRLDRRAKQDIKYTFNSDESSDGATGRNTNCTKRRKPNVYPLKGPSVDRLNAHKLMLLWQKEQSAAEALLQLGKQSNDGETTSYNSDEGTEPSASSGEGSTTENTSSSNSDSNSGSTSSSSSWSTSGASCNSSGYESDSVKSGSDSSSGSNSSDKKEPQSEASDPEDDLPLSQLKDRLNKKNKKCGLKMTMHGIIKRKRKRKFSCKKCNFAGTSQGEINRHFLNDHGSLSCTICGKQCKTISSMRKHNYEHSEKVGKYSCDDCDKRFPFASQLKLHRKKHLTALEHMCIHCNKWFKNRGELTKHLVSHSGKIWHCQKCKYTCNDPRNLRAHMHGHGDKTRYKCPKCTRGFNFYQQLKRHRSLKTCPPLSDVSESSETD